MSAIYYLLATIGCLLLFANAKNFRDPAKQAIFQPNPPVRLPDAEIYFLRLPGEEISW